MARLLSGRVGITSFSGLSTDRYQWIDASQSEPNLNLPENNNYVLYSDVAGNRYWGPVSPSGTVNGITVQDEGVTPVGFAGSITIVNFVGSAVTVYETKQTVGGSEVGVATVIIGSLQNGITIKDEGVVIPAGGVGIITTVNFVGSAISAVATSSGIATVTVNNLGITVQDEGVVIPAGGVGIITTVNFVGSAISAVATSSGIATVTVNNLGITVQDEGVTPVGFANSISVVNFVGDIVQVVQTTQTINGNTVGVATVQFGTFESGVGIGSFIEDPMYDVEYLNPEVGLSTNLTIDSSNMPNATKSWTSYEQFNINQNVIFTIGNGKTFIVDILNLASV
jgi:hypothetical protein